MKSRANHRSYQMICAAIACLLTLGIEQTAVGQAGQEHGDSQEKCPTISVSCPSDLDYSKPVLFKASISGIAPEGIRYDWSVSAGTILEGQGSGTIRVDPDGQAITATVKIHGLPKICSSTASCSLAVALAAPAAVLFDRYYPKSIGTVVPKRTQRRRRAKASLICYV